MVAAERRRTSKFRTRNGTRYLTKALLTVQSIPITCRGSSRWRLSYQGAGRRLQYWSYLVALKTCSGNEFTAGVLQYGGVRVYAKSRSFFKSCLTHSTRCQKAWSEDTACKNRCDLTSRTILRQSFLDLVGVQCRHSEITVGAVTILRERE